MKVRDKLGRFFSLRRLVIVSVLVGLPVGALNVGALEWLDKELKATREEVTETVTDTIPHVYAEEKPAITLEAKVEALKTKIVEDIAECESENAPQESALIVYDNNSRGSLEGKHVPSIGVMQFKVSTVQSFWKTLYGKDITNYEATMIALDNEKAKALAKDAILKIKGAIWHWTCATDEMGTRVEIIRELQN